MKRSPLEIGPGKIAYVQYSEPEELWHQRLLLGEVCPGSWVVMTPTGDVFVEDLSTDPDIERVRYGDEHGASPYGVDAGKVFR